MAKNKTKSKSVTTRQSYIKETKFLNTYTKVFVTIVTIVSLIDLQLCFIMPFFDATVPESLGIALLTEILGVLLGYFVKSYLESREQERNKLQEKKYKLMSDEIKAENDSQDEIDL